MSLLAVMTIMTAVVAASAMPAFAKGGNDGGALVVQCQGVGQQGNIVEISSDNILNHRSTP